MHPRCNRLDSAKLRILRDDPPRYFAVEIVAPITAFQNHQAIKAPELLKLPKLYNFSTLPELLRL